MPIVRALYPGRAVQPTCLTARGGPCRSGAGTHVVRSRAGNATVNGCGWGNSRSNAGLLFCCRYALARRSNARRRSTADLRITHTQLLLILAPFIMLASLTTATYRDTTEGVQPRGSSHCNTTVSGGSGRGTVGSGELGEPKAEPSENVCACVCFLCLSPAWIRPGG